MFMIPTPTIFFLVPYEGSGPTLSSVPLALGVTCSGEHRVPGDVELWLVGLECEVVL